MKNESEDLMKFDNENYLAAYDFYRKNGFQMHTLF